jgi:hypothetical protein
MGISSLPPPTSANLQETQITASGTFTVPKGVTKLWVSVYAGGGGGSSSSQSRPTLAGQAGSVKTQQLTVTPGASLTATIGAGGAASSYQITAGNASVFDTITAGATTTVGQWYSGSGYWSSANSGLSGESNWDSAPPSANAPANSGAGGGSNANAGRNGGSGRIIVRYLG